MIIKTNPGAPVKPRPLPGQQPQEEQKPSAQEQSLLRQKEQIEKRIQRIRPQQQPEQPSGKKVVQAFLKIAQPNPNDNPTSLFDQISGTLDKMGLKNDTERNKTELVIGKTNAKKENMYKILLRRSTEITSDTVNKLNRSSDSLSAIVWTSKGMEAYVWGPYAPPAEENVPEGTPEGVI